jgi:AbrB family looped-hinge helix DNA binding protein
MKLQKTTAGAHIVVIPKAIVESMDWEGGMELEIKTVGKDRLELRRK